MKKHLIRTLVFICGLTLFSSCMKNDPENNPTVYYGYQQIPNINEFMPQRLLKAMDALHCLHYGDEPPRIAPNLEDSIPPAYVADSIYTIKIIKTPNSPWIQSDYSLPNLLGGTQYFEFYEQHKGIAKLNFKSPHYGVFLERSDTDTTYSIVTANPELFINDSIAPAYFKNGNYKKEDFNTVYIMGTKPFFTVYYYEIRDVSWKGQPLNAVIISGEIDEERHVIKNLVWGMETMVLYHHSPIIDNLLQMGQQPNPGDVRILKNYKDASLGEYHE